jgi:hypothetical protein
MAILIVILVASLLALVSSAQARAEARGLQPAAASGIAPLRVPARTSLISAPRMEAFAFSDQQQRNNGPDVLLMVLLTVGAAAAAAFLGLIGYVIRKRIGFWPHRPQPQEGAAAEEHH